VAKPTAGRWEGCKRGRWVGGVAGRAPNGLWQQAKATGLVKSLGALRLCVRRSVGSKSACWRSNHAVVTVRQHAHACMGNVRQMRRRRACSSNNSMRPHVQVDGHMCAGLQKTAMSSELLRKACNAPIMPPRTGTTRATASAGASTMVLVCRSAWDAARGGRLVGAGRARGR
jgi:hypothetical protein